MTTVDKSQIDKTERPNADRWKTFERWFAILGTVGTLVFGFLSLYLFQLSKVEPQLTFMVHSLRTELQTPDFDKDFAFAYAGKPIDASNVTSAQIAIWNAGNKSIKSDSILTPIELTVAPPAKIISARIKSTSRPITEIQLDQDKAIWAQGKCRLAWRLLEEGDGAVIQLIYTGGTTTDITLSGLVEGQKNIIKLASPPTRIRWETSGTWAGYGISMVTTILALMVSDLIMWRKNRPYIATVVTAAAIIIVIIIGVIVMHDLIVVTGPPFRW